MNAPAPSLMASVDARTKLAGTNRLEMLLFSLGVGPTGLRETYGINVFKVREVLRAPAITAAPDMPAMVKGVVSLRGAIIPVIDLAAYCGVRSETPPQIMIVTEYNQSVQAFLVESVDTILRLDWTDVRTPPAAVASRESQGLVVAIAEVHERLVLMIDVEKILVEVLGDNTAKQVDLIQPVRNQDVSQLTIFYADDSSVARKALSATLTQLGFKSVGAINGREAWDLLRALADKATQDHVRLADRLPLIVTDAEMPEMDGYVLTKSIRNDPRMAGIKILMFSSLSSVNTHLGQSVGVDEYIPKMNPQDLAAAIKRHLNLSTDERVLS